MYRYNEMISEVISSAKNGELGTITAVEAQMNCFHGDEMRRWLKCVKGGMMFYLGCHLIDLIMQILGEPEKVVPFNRSSNIGADTEDLGLAVLEYENAVAFAKTTALEVGGFARRQLVVSGTKRTVEIKPLEMFAEGDLLYTEKCEYPSFGWDNVKEFTKSEKYNRYDKMMATFAELVRGEKQNPFTLDYELALYKTVLKACGV
jgi:predicted dehydrogenase